MEQISQQGNRYCHDVLVIGGGIAGLYYALELTSLHPELKIALITKTKLAESNSNKAQGGIAAINMPDDSIEQHIADTKKAGAGLCHQDIVADIVTAGPQAIARLIEHGVAFDTRENEDKYDLAKEGGHSKRRIYHYRDQTGKEIIRALTDQVLQHPKITVYENHQAVNLIKRGRNTSNKAREIAGAYILDIENSLIHTFLAKVTVLATGGSGKVYRYTSNPETATGDGIAMAFRAGARVRNMEFYQFHPTVLYHIEDQNFLITEAIRGEGAYLRSPSTKERFMQHYDRERMELSTRDIVARAIFTEIERSDSHFVYLDIRHKGEEFIKKRFPGIYQRLLQHGINPANDLIPVVPAAHYLCGGIMADVNGKTDIKNLLAIGETACTGFNGANRLASNSLLEAVVMAHKAAKATLELAAKPTDFTGIADWSSHGVIDLRRASQIHAHWRGLRGEMTSYAGIVRTEDGLNDLIRLIRTRRDMIEEYYWKYSITRDLVELRNIALVAELVVYSALKRCESRGVHFREDFPEQAKDVQDSMLSSSETFYYCNSDNIE